MPDVLASLQASVEVDGRRVTLVRGDEIPKGISKADRDRLDGRGSIVSPKVLREQAAERASFAEAGAVGQTVAASPEVAAAPFDAGSASDGELAAWIKDAKPNADDTVAAAGEDAELAARLLDAEQAATGGNPRKTVVKGLEAVGQSE